MRKITLGYLNINRNGRLYVNDVLQSNRLSRGYYTDRFERDFAHEHGCTHGIFLNSGTSALQVSLAALKELYGWDDGDEILVPATTFIATSNIVLQNNMKPMFVDVNPFTFNIDPKMIDAAVTPRTRAIIPVHLFGLPAEMGAIKGIAKYWGLNIIEDSCETMFASADGRRVGSFGDLACFSTYVAHLIVGGVGGVITTSSATLDRICRSLMAHGRDACYTNIDQDDDIDASMIERRYSFERVGYSYRATELEAAIALSELERWKPNIETRRKNAAFLTTLLSDVEGVIQLPFIPVGFEHSFMMYPMVINNSIDRDKFLMHLEKNGIETRYLFPLLTQPIYQRLFPGLAAHYPQAQRLAERGFFIGMHQGLDFEDMEYISKVIHAGL